MPATTLTVEELDREHPEYTARKKAWGDLALLQVGGYLLKQAASAFVIKRPKEKTEIYNLRCQSLVYQNILGTAAGWYGAKLFEREPSITDDQSEKWSDEFYPEFLADCNLAGVKYVDFWRERFKEWLVYGCCWVLTDKPRPETPVESRADEKATGLDRAYSVAWNPLSVINWSCDDYGNIEWVVMRSVQWEQEDPFSKPKEETYWYIFDEQNFYEYKMRETEAGSAPISGDLAAANQQFADLIADGPHALASAGRVPVRRFTVPGELWLGDRAYLQLVDHLNEENTLAWALRQANLCMPVIIGQFNQDTLLLGETTYLHIPDPSGKFQWSEPEGKSFKQSAERVAYLREEIYRTFYLQAQGRSSAATPASQSGYSKQMDMAPASDVLNEYGDLLSAAMQITLEDIVAARADVATKPNVNGFRFETKPITEEIAVAQEYQGLGWDLPETERVLARRVVAAVTDGENEDVKARAMTEVEAMPTAAERDAQAQQNKLDEFAMKFKQSTAKQQIQTEQGALAGA